MRKYVIATVFALALAYPIATIAQGTDEDRQLPEHTATPDSTAEPPILFGIGLVGAAALPYTHAWGAGVDADLVVPLPHAPVGYRLRGFGIVVPEAEGVCANGCSYRAGWLLGASADLALLADVHDGAARTTLSIGPALLGAGDGAPSVAVDVGITRLVSVGQSSAYALSLEPVLFSAGGSMVYLVMASVRAEFW